MSTTRTDYRGRTISDSWWLCAICRLLIGPREPHGHR